MTRITATELVAESVELVPARETLALFNWANVTAQNVSAAVNTMTMFSAAAAQANQAIYVVQH